LLPRASRQCAVPAHGPATIGGGFRKDFNDMRRQARMKSNQP
jgi:hypothetical protein